MLGILGAKRRLSHDFFLLAFTSLLTKHFYIVTFNNQQNEAFLDIIVYKVSIKFYPYKNYTMYLMYEILFLFYNFCFSVLYIIYIIIDWLGWYENNRWFLMCWYSISYVWTSKRVSDLSSWIRHLAIFFPWICRTKTHISAEIQHLIHWLIVILINYPVNPQAVQV